MSASNHDAGMSLAAAAASAAAKQLWSVLGLTRQSPPPSQAPPSPPTSNATAPSVDGLSEILEELRIAEDEKKDKDCEREEGETVAVKDGGSGAVNVDGKAGRVGEEKQNKARKGRGNKANAANAFPQRPGEPDCAFYIKTGRCDYGQSCKFNHPPDRWNRTKYFASQMGCKYGNACIYSHCVEKDEAEMPEIELNFLGLPLRPGEQECPLYLETGACQDSTYCKYHHPNPTVFGDRDQPSEFAGSSTSLPPDFGNASWVSESTTYGLHPYMGASLPYLQGMPGMHQVPSLNTDCHTYQDPTPGQNISNAWSDGHPSSHVDGADFQYQERKPASPQPGSDYPPAGFLPTPPSTRVVPGSYQQPYRYQSPPGQQNSPPPPPSQNYPYDGSPPNYPSYDTYATNYSPHETTPHAPSISPYTYPNFQSYPSFTETSLPTAPSRHPSFHQGSDNAYSHQSPPTSNYPTTSQYSSGTSNAFHSPSPPPPPAPTYTYDCNYEPSVEKIAEAHKAARFAVGALAFDDVPVAVEFLRKSLELLTNPSAETH